MKHLFLILLSVLIIGCSMSVISPFETSLPFVPVEIDGGIVIKGMIKKSTKSKSLLVFIEGDGRAWINSRTPSLDPTPLNPVGWKIVSQSEYGDILYLARPCQYLNERQRQSCTQDDWTNGRFSLKLVNLLDNAITQVKQQGGYDKVVLGGYSGGGVMAALIALQRSDVIELISVASPIDTDRWGETHGLSPLKGSLNPANEITKLSRIPQHHYVGEKDEIVPPHLIRYLISLYPLGSSVQISEIRGADHSMEGFKIPF